MLSRSRGKFCITVTLCTHTTTTPVYALFTLPLLAALADTNDRHTAPFGLAGIVVISSIAQKTELNEEMTRSPPLFTNPNFSCGFVAPAGLLWH